VSGQLVAFVGVSLVVIATPGPDTALTIRNTLLGGRRCGVLTAAGVACGQATWAICTAAGLSQLLRASQPAFLALRLVGASYLVYLGVRALIEAVRGDYSEGAVSAHRLSSRASWRQGLFSNLGNPKMVVFFISLLPQFAGAGATFSSLLALGLLFSLLTLGWLAGYAFVVAKAGDLLRRGRIRRLLEAASGAALVGLGLRLAGER
jgi:threonine/homoserine/homoserine lactone efflux protein